MKLEKPYYLKQKRFWMFYYKFEIMYQDIPIYRIIGGFQCYNEVKNIITLLNAAYNEGRLFESRAILGFNEGSEYFLKQIIDEK